MELSLKQNIITYKSLIRERLAMREYIKLSGSCVDMDEGIISERIKIVEELIKMFKEEINKQDEETLFCDLLDVSFGLD